MLREPIQNRWAHICVDMQLLFAPGSEWGLEWMPRVLPNIVRLCEARPPSTVFTRFIPARRAGEGEGLWREYYVRWRQFTLEEEGRGLVDLVPELDAFCPPAKVIDKPVYSPWYGRRLRALLQEDSCDTVIISGGETDVCVLSTVLGAIDWGYRAILVGDAVCSVSDEAHDAILKLFNSRYSQHVETASTEEVLSDLH